MSRARRCIQRAVLLSVLVGCADELPERVDLDDGYYLLIAPETLPRGPVPAVVHLHGHGGEPEKYLKNRALLRDFKGWPAIVAFPAGESNDWKIGPHVDDIERDDRAFLDAVAADLRDRFEPSGVWLSGHSNGASMVYDHACSGSGDFDGYLPISGGFWEPLPSGCRGPARPIQHLHGVDDGLWPLEGRPIGGTSQVGPSASLSTLRTAWGCTDEGVSADTGPLTCTAWPSCDMTLCLHGGQHKLPDGWATWHLDWITASTE